jgi:hypothetical protein
MNYTFSTLNDRDLEELARDLLSRELKCQFQNFKPGRDKGIDLRYSESIADPGIVVQVKHYLKSGMKSLLRDLKNEECSKIQILSPTRYILVTSLPLSHADKIKIATTLSPFIRNHQDIIGQEDLNRMLLEYKSVEDAHFKLWLSNTNVLSRIIHNGVKGRSSFTKEQIEKQIHLFVRNEKHDQAVKMLNKHNFLVITGAPGIGKSTLSKILCYQLMATDFELINVYDIKEAEEVILPDKKQVFFIDDFLGAITLDLQTQRNADTQLVEFISRIRSDKTKRLILTCRTVILNQAKDSSEKIERANLEIARHEIVLRDYTEYDKARILYNHIYASPVSKKLKELFVRDQFYWQVILHRNYNPRLIEFLTDPTIVPPDENYTKTVLSLLENPSKIWEKPFNTQLTAYSRILLRTLFSFEKSDVSPKQLKIAFEAQLKRETELRGFVHKPTYFSQALKELEGAYIATTHRVTQYGTFAEIRISNPALEDYLVYYYSTEGLDEYLDSLHSAVFIEQIGGHLTTKKEYNRIHLNDDNQKRLWKMVASTIGTFQTEKGNARINEQLILTRLFHWNLSSIILLPFLETFDQAHVSWTDFDRIVMLLEQIHKSGHSQQVDHLLEKYFVILSNSIVSHWQLSALRRLIGNNLHYFEKVLELRNADSEIYQIMQQEIDQAWGNHMSDFVTHLLTIQAITVETEMRKRVKQSIQSAESINLDMGFAISPKIESFHFNYKRLLSLNKKQKNKKKDKLVLAVNLNKNDVNDVNDLFNANDLNKGNLNECPF